MSNETTFRAIAHYHLEISGYTTEHRGELTLTLDGDATTVAQIALDAVRTAAGTSTVTNLQFQIAIVHGETVKTGWNGEVL